MQNTRSKSTTSAVYTGPFPASHVSPAASAWGMPATAGGVTPAPRLRLVPGRIVLFLLVLVAVSLLLVPRMVSAVSSVSEPRTHVVEAGETLWAVAGEFGDGADPRVYVDDLLEINHLSSPQVFPGQTLILP